VDQPPVIVEAGPAASGAVEPATLESIRDDVEEVVVEQALAAERSRHVAPDRAPEQPAPSEPAAPETAPSESAASEPTAPETAPSESAASESAASEPAPSAPLSGPTNPIGNGVAVHPVDPAAVTDGRHSADEAPGQPTAEPRRAARRRGRVTRTAGAPTGTAGDAPVVAVVTVPVTRPDGPSHVVPAPVLDAAPDVAPASPPASSSDGASREQPAPVTARPRRARRAASRPAGPPAAETAAAGTAGNGAADTAGNGAADTAGNGAADTAGNEVDPV
jgi:ribonuclease E